MPGQSQTPAFVRTLVPFAVGLAGSWLTRHGLHVNDDMLSGLLVGVFGYVWYVVVHTVELKYPRFGYLLGVAKSPTYLAGPEPAPGPGEKVVAVVVPDPVDDGAKPPGVDPDEFPAGDAAQQGATVDEGAPTVATDEADPSTLTLGD